MGLTIGDGLRFALGVALFLVLAPVLTCAGCMAIHGPIDLSGCGPSGRTTHEEKR